MNNQAQNGNAGNAGHWESPAEEPVELSLNACGYDICDPGTKYLPKKRSCFRLYAIRNGRGSCTVNGRRYDMEAQDAMLIFPGWEDAFAADSKEGCTRIWIDFTGSRVEAYLQSAGFSGDRPSRRIRCIQQMEKILTQMLVHQRRVSNQLRANGHFQVFLGELVEENASRMSGERLQQLRGPKTSEYVKNAMDYLSKHYPETIKIKELADIVGINRSYFASSFKKATGYSPKAYLLSLRMEKAKTLLVTTEMPIGSISTAIGYEDALAFSRIFKRHTGLSPTDYRAQNKSRFE